MKERFLRVKALTGRNLREMVRDPVSLSFMLGLPLIMLVLFWALFHKLTAQFEMRYLAPGIVVFGQTFLALFSGILISMDRATSFLTRLYTTPTHAAEFILGYVCALLPVGAAQSVLFFAVACVIDHALFTPRLLLGVAASLVTGLLFIGFGILFGTVCNEKSVGGVSSVLVMGQSVLSGMWFPLEGISAGFLTAMNCLPFRNGTLLLQHLVNGAEDVAADILRPLGVLAAYTVCVFVISVLVYARAMRRK